MLDPCAVAFRLRSLTPPDTWRCIEITLPPEDLLARLAEDYVFAEIGEAVMLSFAAGNEARRRAMIAAHDNVSQSLADLVALSRRLRQDEITDEITELGTANLPVR